MYHFQKLSGVPPLLIAPGFNRLGTLTHGSPCFYRSSLGKLCKCMRVGSGGSPSTVEESGALSVKGGTDPTKCTLVPCRVWCVTQCLSNSSLPMGSFRGVNTHTHTYLQILSIRSNREIGMMVHNSDPISWKDEERGLQI